MSSLTPLVSVCCITYNHEKFIREAVDSFLMQNTNFPIEIIIHDDASIDNTADIIREYQQKYPHLIKTILRTENQYSLKGFGFLQDLFNEARGKYLALCEGDDYWTDPLKLQKQVDFLEANNEFVLCFHSALVKHEDSSDNYLLTPQINKDIFDVADIILLPWFIPTASMVFKNINLKFPEWFSNSLAGDMALHLLLSHEGKFKHFNEVMSVYRKHELGMTNCQKNYYFTQTIPNRISMYGNFNAETNYVYNQQILATIEKLLTLLFTPKATLAYCSNIEEKPEMYISRVTDIIFNISSKLPNKIQSSITAKPFIKKLLIHGLYLHGNTYYTENKYAEAFNCYFKILQVNSFEPRAIIYCLLLSLGSVGQNLRTLLNKLLHSIQ